ncbi:hypothetical protein PGTUg99_027312 [Puccinia graminis f. sp. tritici]|uniref:Uncharacterized protein n=1 Tax=Puccinia graminis f. sp. tritici TaxID=56615 RepID=A0A5B0Q4C9_PUCGR|nr:hypothetical protein PGTUg99_027312 [Puccinia graminis f. sp. tritici]
MRDSLQILLGVDKLIRQTFKYSQVIVLSQTFILSTPNQTLGRYKPEETDRIIHSPSRKIKQTESASTFKTEHSERNRSKQPFRRTWLV